MGQWRGGDAGRALLNVKNPALGGIFLGHEASKHRMPARRFFRHGLGDVPVFDDFPVFVQAEDVDDRFAAIVRRGLAVDVNDDQIPFGDDTLDVGARLRVFFEERREGVDECLAAVGDAGIVLDVRLGDVFGDRFFQFVLVKGEFVEGDDVFLVARKRVGGKSQRGAAARATARRIFFMMVPLS